MARIARVLARYGRRAVHGRADRCGDGATSRDARYGRDVARLLRIVVERRVHGWGQLSVHHAREDVSFPLESGRPETLEDGGCELRGERLSDSEARK